MIQALCPACRNGYHRHHVSDSAIGLSYGVRRAPCDCQCADMSEQERDAFQTLEESRKPWIDPELARRP